MVRQGGWVEDKVHPLTVAATKVTVVVDTEVLRLALLDEVEEETGVATVQVMMVVEGGEDHVAEVQIVVTHRGHATKTVGWI
jgi:hypothetical protein